MQTVLRVEGICKSFPGVQALDKVDLRVASGEVLAIVGENGAGKSTLMKILSGAYRKDSGRIFLNGRKVEIAGPLAAQQLGIAIIYQEFNLTRNQSVATNIFLAREPLRGGLGRFLRLVDRRRMEKAAARLLERVKARISPGVLVGDLSVAQQQMVEIVKALSLDAQIIIMDEPTATLGEQEVQTLFATIRSLKEQGVSVIFITHRLEEIFSIADRIAVLRDGQLVGELPVSEADVDRVVHLMVGRSLKDFLHKEKAEITTPVLEVRGLTRGGVIRGVSFTLRHGEILGFTGLVGAGRTETARIIFGVDPRDAGEILVEGKPVSLDSPKDAVAAGISLVPEDRGRQGLVLMQPVLNNIVMASLKRHSRRGWMNKDAMRNTARHYIDLLAVRTPHLKQKAMYLSGGNQQKVVLAKWLASQPKILILDEPTRGIDVGSKAEVHALISKLAQSGIGIIMISSELPEILGMSDRILVMHEGGVAAVLDRREATQELIMAYASGTEKNDKKERSSK
jgi:ribose transport system ATP-binding protein